MELDALDRALDAEEAELKAQAEAKKTERDAFFTSLPGDARSRYEAIHRGRPGFVAVVPVNAMVCGGCRTGLTPNLVNQVMKGKEIITCESCSGFFTLCPNPRSPHRPTGRAPFLFQPNPPPPLPSKPMSFWTAYCDGGFPWQSGTSVLRGCSVRSDRRGGGRGIGERIGINTNQVAEYEALIRALAETIIAAQNRSKS